MAPVLAHAATHLAWPTQCTGKRSRAYPQAGALSRYEGPKRTKHHAKTNVHFCTPTVAGDGMGVIATDLWVGGQPNR